MPRQIEPTNRYADVLVKLIPTEIIGAYMVIAGFISPGLPGARWIALSAGLVLLVIIPFYLRMILDVQRRDQWIFTCLSFVVWVYWMGGPFQLWGIHIPQIASIILVLWTLLIPLVNRPKIVRGQLVRIATNKPDLIEGTEIGVVWDEEMDRYVGQEARITSYDKMSRTVKLSVDDGKYAWSEEWIRIATFNGETK
jgi:hypothetical protein